MKIKYLSLLIILLITFIAPMIGSYATTTFKEPWYSQIILPSFNPPSWVFGPVWTILYVLMSVAIWRVWINYYDKKILNIYFLHLFFNMIWSIIFFWFSSNRTSITRFSFNYYIYCYLNENLLFKG